MLSILNKFTVQKQLQFFMTNNVCFLTNSKHTTKTTTKQT